MTKKYACKSFNGNKKNYNAYLKLHTISTELPEVILKRKEDYCSLFSVGVTVDSHFKTFVMKLKSLGFYLKI